VSEQTGSSGTRRGLRVLLLLVGGAMMIAGVWVIADNYAADYDCFYELTCHNEGGRTPSAADRLTAALGFGLEPAAAVGDPLPEPWGTMLVVGGAVVLLAAAFVGPSPGTRERSIAAQPMSVEHQLLRYERLHERGTLSDEEFERRKARLAGQRGPQWPDFETS
jgi:hypothetical protein